MWQIRQFGGRPILGTVLANEEVEEWKAKGHTVEKRPLRQWMLRITKYAQRLIDDLEGLDWPSGIKLLQKNWIGKSEGALVRFQVDGFSRELEIFTTRPDTLFAVTYMVLAPEHPWVDEITSEENEEKVKAYQKACLAKSDLDRSDLNKDKSGVPTGAFAVNPVNGERVPIWIADYVMMSYGTGAIMAVPGHDERDREFAQKYDLPIRESLEGELSAVDTEESVGKAPTSDEVIEWLQERKIGERKVQYKLRDWLFSRQRYWGEPFPIYWKNGQHHGLSVDDLPLLAPPLDDYKPSGSPEPILSKAREWVQMEDGALRETNTMPQWAGSCWYYLRYCDPKNEERFIGRDVEEYWTDEKPGMVDLYIGGTEHAVLHLLYARFWHKVLYDLGEVRTSEPFQKLVNQGLIMGEDGQKMSKSRGNVVNPDDVILQYGADSLRLYEMFMGPLEQVKPWQMKGVEGVSRFLARVWRLAISDEGKVTDKIAGEGSGDKEMLRILHETIKKVGEDIEKLSFNTAISQMMICTNAFTQAKVVLVDDFVTFLRLLNPFAPHITEEIHAILAKHFSLTDGLLSGG